MKTKHVVWIGSVMAFILASDCHAQLNGSDDFDDNSKNAALWDPDFTQGMGLLTETNGRLEFTTSGIPTPSALAARPWIFNFGSYTQDWEVRVDASLPSLGFSETTVGLSVTLGTNLDINNRFSLQLDDSSSEGRLFLLKLRVNGGSDDRVVELGTTSTFVGLRIAFEARTKIISAFYDGDGPNGGYSWTLLGSTNISTAWTVTASNVFEISVFGRVEGGPVASADNVFADNFYALSETAPSLGINLSGSNVMLIWSTNALTYKLQSASALPPPVGWQDVTNMPGIVSTNFTVTNTLSSDKRFYRLIR